MREVPMVLINIYDPRPVMLYILCFANISHGSKSSCAQSMVTVDMQNGILAKGAKTLIAMVLRVCLKNLPITESKYRYFSS